MAQNNINTLSIDKDDVINTNTKYYALLFVKSQKPPFEKYIKMNGLAYEALQALEKLHLQIKKDIFTGGMIDTPTTKIPNSNKKNNGIMLK